MTALGFRSGAIGALHLAAGASGSSFLESLEVIGEGSNVTIAGAWNWRSSRTVPVKYSGTPGVDGRSRYGRCLS